MDVAVTRLAQGISRELGLALVPIAIEGTELFGKALGARKGRVGSDCNVRRLGRGGLVFAGAEKER